jgi:uncharacterized OB-fold protein
MLTPATDDDGAPFWDYARAGELRVQACAACGRLRFPPRPCMSGRGRIWSYVVPHPPLLPDYAAQAPYNVILVELAEDPRIRLVGNLVTAPDAPLNSLDPARIRINTPVKAVFHDGIPRWLAV